MSTHPADAATIADLGVDYLIDRTRLDRADHGFDTDSSGPVDPAAMEERVRLRLDAAAQLAADAGWRRQIRSLIGAGPARTPALAGLVLRREGARRFDPVLPLAAQLDPDVQAILDALAFERQALAAPVGDTGVPLAAPLRPRTSVPLRGVPRPGALQVVEIGDLGDPFSCLAHDRVYAELGELRECIAWQWLYCATPRSLAESHRAGAVAEQVLELAPDSFWAVVDTLAARGLGDGSEHAQAVLAAAGADPALGRLPPDGASLPLGLLADRTMATVCGLPRIRPLFAVGRTVLVGTDAAQRLRTLLE